MFVLANGKTCIELTWNASLRTDRRLFDRLKWKRREKGGGGMGNGDGGGGRRINSNLFSNK